MATTFEGMVKRSQKLAFYGVKEGDNVTFERMTNFTSLSTSKNPKEYTRQYIDVDYEDTDVTGYSPSMSYGFDQYAGNTVHEDIAKIHDNELVGTGAVRSIIVVDMTSETTPAGTFEARKRDFAVVPDAEGDNTDVYTFSGNLRAKGAVIKGTATTLDGWQTCTFTEQV